MKPLSTLPSFLNNPKQIARSFSTRWVFPPTWQLWQTVPSFQKWSLRELPGLVAISVTKQSTDGLCRTKRRAGMAMSSFSLLLGRSLKGLTNSLSPVLLIGNSACTKPLHYKQVYLTQLKIISLNPKGVQEATLQLYTSCRGCSHQHFQRHLSALTPHAFCFKIISL